MKKLFGSFLALFSAAAISATTVPVQLISPTASSSGQAIVSTGTSSAPSWGGVGVNGIAAIAANTVLANATGSSASPTAFAMPNCSTGVIHWVSGAGFTCSNTVSSLTSTGSITPSTTAGIIGTTTNDNANAGSFGEFIAQQNPSASLSTGVTANVTSITLTAGDWDVEGNVEYVAAAGTSIAQCVTAVTSTSATIPSAPARSVGNYSAPAGNSQSQVAPILRFSISSTTTVYLVANSTFGGGTLTASGFIRARRVR